VRGKRHGERAERFKAPVLTGSIQNDEAKPKGGGQDARSQTGDHGVAGTNNGEMAERFKAPVLKTGVAAMSPWVRIPLSPPIVAIRFEFGVPLG
jgi:hypothetical protein